MNKDPNKENQTVDNDFKAKLNALIRNAENYLKQKCEDFLKEYKSLVTNLRVDYSDLSKKVKVLEEKNKLYEDYIREDLKNKIKNLQQVQLRQKLEDKAANFLSGDGGLLFNVAEMLNQAEKCLANPNGKEIEKFQGFFIWPLNNKLVVYDRKTDNPDNPDSEVDDSQSIVELMDMHKRMSQADKPTPNLDLMAALSPILHEMAAAEFESNLEKLPAEQAAELIKAKANEIVSVLKKHGIGIIYEPDSTTIRFFAKPKSGESPRPLVIRLSDQLVYTNGISEQADEQLSLY